MALARAGSEAGPWPRSRRWASAPTQNPGGTGRGAPAQPGGPRALPPPSGGWGGAGRGWAPGPWGRDSARWAGGRERTGPPPPAPPQPRNPMSDLVPRPASALPAWRARTPARVLAGRAGPAYRTATLLGLRGDHAAARDAVQAEVELRRDLGETLVESLGLFEVSTRAASKEEYLLRPDLGRQLGGAAREAIRQRCPAGADLQVLVGDGLSAAAVAAQVPTLLPLLVAQARERGWAVGQTFFVRHCRVGVLNDVGELL